MSEAPIEASVPDGFPGNNIPAYLTSFVGRERELGELRTLLDTTRLLMLTGSGGSGKTRLAARLAGEGLDHFEDGVWWLELASVGEPELVDTALAAAVGVRPLPGRTPLEAAVTHLTLQRALLVFDNCEHVLDRCRHLVVELLRGCPNLTILATSREPLGVGGETSWRVPSLSLGAPGAIDGSATSMSDAPDAVCLFAERAMKVRPDFVLTAENLPSVNRICEALDGIPLAIELAAVRVRVLSVERIDAELADRFRLLTGGERGALPRLRTMRASVDWSFELLEPVERVLLRRCGVFSGGFTLEACEEVCAGAGVDRSEVLDLITSLVDKSLVLVEDRDSSRFGLLETIRQYALEKLAEAGEHERLLARHAEAFVALAERMAPTLGSDVDSDDVLGAESANLYAAIEHTARVSPESSLRCCAALAYWWLLTGRLVEGPRALSRALDASAAVRSSVRASSLFWRGYLAFYAGDYERTRADQQEALELARELGDASIEARAFNALGLLGSQTDPHAAIELLDRACELARTAPDTWCLSEATQNVGWALVQMGRYEEARAALDASFEIADPQGWRELVSWHWLMLGHTTYPTGDLATARTSWERGLLEATDVQEGFGSWSLALVDVDTGGAAAALARLERDRPRMIVMGAGLGVQFVDSGIGLAHASLGNLDDARRVLTAAAAEHAPAFQWAEAITRIDLAHVELLLGDHESAKGNAEKALSIAEKLGHVGLAGRARLQIGAVAAATSDWAGAERMAHLALGDALERGDHVDMPESLELLAAAATGLERFAEAARVLAAAGRARAELGRARWKPDEERVNALVGRLLDALGGDELADLWDQGEAMPLTEAIDYVRRARGSRQRPSHGWESLTPTELAVVRHAAAGLTNPEIAELMFISRGTVKAHLSHVYAKVGLRNRSEVAAEAIRRHLVDHP